MAVEYRCCESEFFINILVIVFLVVFAGMMSGLTLGLMSLSLVDLEVLAKSGTPSDRKNAAKILPVVKNQHLLLCTLLICNSAAMEALPIFLDSLITAWGAILISVTLILLFGEIIPQSVCSRYGLAIGATTAPVVRVLVWICFPISYPISKLLDYLLGHRNSGLFRRAELKTLVHFHGNQAGKGGELTNDETTIIAGALELHDKTAGDAMTPISETFSIDINGKLDRDLTNLILSKGHSRIPVYYEQPKNIIGLLLVKNLLTIHPADETPVKNVTIRKIPSFSLFKMKCTNTRVATSTVLVATYVARTLRKCGRIRVGSSKSSAFWKDPTRVRLHFGESAQHRVPYTMRLDDILNEFQKGHSHMAMVVKQSSKEMVQPAGQVAADDSVQDVRVDIDVENPPPEKSLKSRSLQKCRSLPDGGNTSSKRNRSRRTWSKDMHSDILRLDENLPNIPDEEEVVGIITMEDVIEELLQEEIFDETDHAKHL